MNAAEDDAPRTGRDSRRAYTSSSFHLDPSRSISLIHLFLSVSSTNWRFNTSSSATKETNPRSTKKAWRSYSSTTGPATSTSSRDQLPAYILLAGYTGFRPCALLGLRWADLKLMWVRHKDGRVELALLVTPAKTKCKKKRKWA